MVFLYFLKVFNVPHHPLPRVVPFTTLPAGSDTLRGAWPRRIPGRGSGASPWKRGAGRASRCTEAPLWQLAWRHRRKGRVLAWEKVVLMVI